MRPHCFARCRPVTPARVLGCTGIAEGVAFSSPAFMRGMYFSTNLILVNAVNHLDEIKFKKILLLPYYIFQLFDKITANTRIRK